MHTGESGEKGSRDVSKWPEVAWAVHTLGPMGSDAFGMHKQDLM